MEKCNVRFFTTEAQRTLRNVGEYGMRASQDYILHLRLNLDVYGRQVLSGVMFIPHDLAG